MSSGVAIAILLVLFIASAVSCYALWKYSHSQRLHADLQADAAAKEKSRAELALAKTHQEQALADIRATTNVLERLLATVTEIADGSQILTNDNGKLVSRHPSLVAAARHIFENDLKTVVDRDRVITRLEGARRIQQQMLDANGTAYEPTVDILVTAKESASWADERLQTANQVRDKINTLVRDSKIKVVTGVLTNPPPMLEEAIANLTEQETQSAQQLVITQTALAKAEAARQKAELEVQAIRAEAQRTAKKMEADQKEKDAAAQHELAERTAQAKIADAKSQVKVATAEDEAAKVQLRKKAADPAVLSKLSPFLTPGRQQMTTMTAQPEPFSYSDLVRVQVLDPSMNGYKQLLTLAWRPDRERPRWTMNPQLFQRHPDEVNRIAEAQHLLIELGPVLVEMGKLRP